MSRLHALRALSLFVFLIVAPSLAMPELRTAWIVAACSLALLAMTAAMAILSSGQYRRK